MGGVGGEFLRILLQHHAYWKQVMRGSLTHQPDMFVAFDYIL